jgi:hypothetical protein
LVVAIDVLAGHEGLLNLIVKTSLEELVTFIKQNFMKTTLFICAMVITLGVRSQDVYWVTESNANVPQQTIVKIYDLNQVLLAEYHLDKDIKFFRKRDKRLLNRLAERAQFERAAVATKKSRKGRKPAQVSKV